MAENHIRNPFEMAFQGVSDTVADVGRVVTAPVRTHSPNTPVRIRRIGAADLVDALRGGWSDLGASRTDVFFLCLIYPLAGLALASAAANANFLPMLFPLAAGFALLGPLAAVGLYEISRRREQGLPVHWSDALDVFRSPALGSILGLGALMVLVFAAWMVAAWAIYQATLGPEAPASIGAFVRDVFTTTSGWAMIGLGFGVGFIFAVVALAISVVSFPMALDRDVNMGKAVSTSVKAVMANPRTMGLWGAIVAALLAIGSIPALVGLIFVMPLLGHATWRLYRRVITSDEADQPA